jgi:zinc/manganese transport system substrate-binding protein
MSLTKRGAVALTSSLFLIFFLSACGGSETATSNTSPTASSSNTINVVAAENFYGDIVKQLGGEYVTVTSILSDPEIDPHEYESNVQNGIAVTKAQLIVKNGGGYDEWMDKLLSASPNDRRIVVSGFDIATTRLPNNEHIWYSVDAINVIAQAITDSLKKLDATNAVAYNNNFQTFKQSLDQVQKKIDALKAKYANTPVGLTETIFLYQTKPMGLKVVTPLEFQEAVAEGHDPPADTVATVNNQVSKGEIRVLIYNEQTATPLTTKLKSEAQARNIPVVAVTETMPKGKTYQAWMMGQLETLEKALQISTDK